MDGGISLILFIVEFGLLLFIWNQASTHPNFKSIAFIMVLLQVYQLMEFMICIGLSENVIGRIAFITITLLPAMGHLLTNKLLKSTFPDYVISFVPAGFFAVYYGMIPDSVSLVDCNPFYAIYNYPLSKTYGYYYFGILFYSILKILIFSLKNPMTEQLMLVLGYLGFILPMALTIVIDESLSRAIPSIMCKYAIVLALILTLLAYQGRVVHSNLIQV